MTVSPTQDKRDKAWEKISPRADSHKNKRVSLPGGVVE